MKLKIKANIEGIISLSARQKSEVLLIFTVDGILISIINKVNAIANTPSQKASNRELGFVSAIFCWLVALENKLVQYTVCSSKNRLEQ